MDNNNFAIASMNATIIAILVAIISAYLLYKYSAMQKIEYDAIKVAEGINAVRFSNYKYITDDLKKLKPPEFPEDSNDYNIMLVLLLSSENMDNDVFKKHKLIVPKDKAERGELALKLLNIYLKSYPMVEGLRKEKNGWSQGRYDPIVFSDFNDFLRWFKDAKAHVNTLANGFFIASLLNEKFGFEVLMALREKSPGSHNESINSSPLQDPYEIFNDYKNKFHQIKFGVINRINFEVKKIDKMKRELPNRYILATGLIVSFITFCFGVAYPVVRPEPFKLICLYIPIAVYVTGYFYFGIFVIRRLF